MKRTSQGGNLLDARPGSKPTFSPISLATPSMVSWCWLNPSTDFKECEYRGKLYAFPAAICTQTAAPNPTHGGLLPAFKVTIDGHFWDQSPNNSSFKSLLALLHKWYALEDQRDFLFLFFFFNTPHPPPFKAVSTWWYVAWAPPRLLFKKFQSTFEVRVMLLAQLVWNLLFL